MKMRTTWINLRHIMAVVAVCLGIQSTGCNAISDLDGDVELVDTPDGGTGTISCDELEDCPAPTSPCVESICLIGIPEGICAEIPSDEGSICPEGVCKSMCSEGMCSGMECIKSCPDGQVNGHETDVDCGGNTSAETQCPRCENGRLCKASNDCVSLVCAGGTCQSPTCTDDAINGTESDRDCGGGDCDPCENDRQCKDAADCLSGVCQGNVCQAPLCSDTVKNGMESDVDCGAGCPGQPCSAGQGCTQDADCKSNVCDLLAGVCVSTCTDGEFNAPETDEDCGGPNCPGCALGEICISGSDCQSLSCENGMCADPKCSDGAQNGIETDLDCGGTCPTCPDGLGCLENKDCASMVCTGQLCSAPSCSDLTKNGPETDTDCGGNMACPLCGLEKNCTSDADCQSAICTANLCKPSRCGDAIVQTPYEQCDTGDPPNTVMGCNANCQLMPGWTCVGAICTDACGNGAISTLNMEACDDGNSQPNDGCSNCVIDMNYVCEGEPSACADCANMVKDSGEADIDCGGLCSQLCATGSSCITDTDCASGTCDANTCQLPTCTDGIHNGGESDVDCGGTCPDACMPGQMCQTALDCSSGVCTMNACQPPQCGDSVLNGSEQCEDGGLVNGDGCSGQCQAEVGFTCSGASISTCTPLCGDMYVRGQEQCDDGNTSAGDGCNSACQWEAIAESGDHGESVATATGIGPTHVATGTINNAGDKDWFKLNVAPGSVLRIETFDGATLTDCANIDTKLKIFHSDGQTLLYESDDDGIGQCSALVITLSPTLCGKDNNGNALPCLAEVSGTEGIAYALQIKQQIPSTETESPIHDNNSADTAEKVLTPPASDVFIAASLGMIPMADSIDYFAVFVPEGRSIRAEIIDGATSKCQSSNSNQLDSTMSLYGPDGVSLLADDMDGGRGTCSLIDGTGMSPLHPAAHGLSAGNYFIAVTGSGKPNYKLALTVR